MKTFAAIREMAVNRKDEVEYAAQMPSPPDVELKDQSDDRILSGLSERVFAAGFNWDVIRKKWPGFEEAFHGFDIGHNALMSEEDLDRHLQNTAIVRNAQKILSIRDNSVFLSDLAKEHGSAASYLGNWPKTDTVGLFELLKKRGSRLGGMTGQYGLRFLGYDAFILSNSVVSALNMAGVIDGAATSKSAQRQVQEAFNAWAEESGESHAVISRTLALAVPD